MKLNMVNSTNPYFKKYFFFDGKETISQNEVNTKKIFSDKQQLKS